MNSEQAVLIVAGIDAATRAGFTVSVEPMRDGVVVRVGRAFIMAGKASSRVEPFDVVGRNAREALGNAIAVLTLEIAADRRAQELSLTAEAQ